MGVYHGSLAHSCAPTTNIAIVIVLNILCDNGHHFEGWFASSDAFRDQCARELVNCPHCQSALVSQLPSAPRVRRAASRATETSNATSAIAVAEATGLIESAPAAFAPETAEASQKLHEALTALVRLARNAENVGERFPEEARRIHYEEAPPRHIRGVASARETLDLLDEGIIVLPALVPPDGETH
jgi:hypothetical protein